MVTCTMYRLLPFCPRVLSDDEKVAEEISEGLLSASMYPTSIPARAPANTE